MTTYRIARAVAREFHVDGMNRDDLTQEAAIAVWEAEAAYRADGRASFARFAGVCARRRLLTLLRASQREKRAGERLELFEDAAEDPRADVVGLVAARAELRRLTRALPSLTVAERAALSGLVNGRRIAGSADMNARFRAVRKLREAA